MGTRTTDRTGSIVVSALNSRWNFGMLLDYVADERGSLVIERCGTPKVVLLSIRDYINLAAQEPEVLRIIGEESNLNGTDKMTHRQIEKESRHTGHKRRALGGFAVSERAWASGSNLSAGVCEWPSRSVPAYGLTAGPCRFRAALRPPELCPSPPRPLPESCPPCSSPLSRQKPRRTLPPGRHSQPRTSDLSSIP